MRKKVQVGQTEEGRELKREGKREYGREGERERERWEVGMSE